MSHGGLLSASAGDNSCVARASEFADRAVKSIAPVAAAPRKNFRLFVMSSTVFADYTDYE
jgi:hypothetical protein